jgi:diguanylate cyclase (GGDEF)-like protein/PAS domain S-box-containing protein
MQDRAPSAAKPFSHPLGVAFAVFLGALALCVTGIGFLKQRAEHRERAQVTALGSSYVRTVQAAIENVLSANYALSALVRQGAGDVADFETVATELIAHRPGLLALALAPEGIVQRVAPLMGNEKLIGFNLAIGSPLAQKSHLAQDTGQLTLTGPETLRQGGKGEIAQLPVYMNDAHGIPQYWGMVVAVMRVPEALEPAKLDQLTAQDLSYTIWRMRPNTSERQVMAGSGTTPLIAPVNLTVEMPNGPWTLSVAPNAGWSATAPWAVFAALALVLSALLAYTTKLRLELGRTKNKQNALITQSEDEKTASQVDLQATLDAIPDMILELGLDGTCHTYHASRTDSIFPPSEFWLVKNIAQLLSPEATRGVLLALELADRTGYAKGHEFSYLTPDNVLHWFEMSITRKQDGPAGDSRFIALTRNVSHRKQTEAYLRVAAVAFTSHEGMVVTGADEKVLRVNPSFTAMTGYSAAEAIDKNLDFLYSGRHEPSYYENIRQSVTQTGAWRGELWAQRKSGNVFPSQCSITAVFDDDGVVTNYVHTLTDITQRKATEEEINKLAFYDPLTALPNRRLLIDRLRQAMALSSRNGQMGALLFMDLDNFKTLNDTLGHDMGDLLLQQVAKRLSDNVREGDTVSRLGGDEFVVMLEELGENQNEAVALAKAIGEKVLGSFFLPFRLAGLDYQITPSIGITQYLGHQDTTDELLKQADLAMYQAKAAGRNTLRFFDPSMQSVVTARAALEGDIRQGIAKGELLLYFQPQIDREGRTFGAEVLLRWPHPVRGMVPPNHFIPLSEETGQILSLGNWVLETACQQLTDWAKRDEMAHLTLAVNVSARQFRQQDFVPYVLDLLDYTGANPRRLKLELTESMLVHDVEETIGKMSTLRERGISFSLDDFGTGYSSLSYLKRLPLDQLKIDQSFVRDLMTDTNDAAIANTVITLGHSLGLSVIAEGVETAEQRDFLATHGCDAYQGFLLGRPMPLADFEHHITRTR